VRSERLIHQLRRHVVVSLVRYKKYASYEYVPFGGGVRRCLGAAFSDYETRILLATLLRHVRLELERPRPDPRIRRNITLGPKHGVPMRVVGRRRA
jgi:cytochrome P450